MKVYFDHNVVQYGWLDRVLDEPALASRMYFVISEAHWFETILACFVE